MAPKKIAVLLGKVLALFVIMTILIMIGGQVMRGPAPVSQGMENSPQAFKPLSAAEQQAAAKVLPLIALMNTLVLAYIVQRARWRGWRLVASMFVFFFGSTWFMAQIETVVFLPAITYSTIAKLMLMGLIVAAPFSFLATVIFGKLKGTEEVSAHDAPHGKDLAIRMAAIGVIYIVVYFLFGYYVAWKNPAVQAYYSGSDPGSFGLQLRSVANGIWWLYPLQFVRGVLWALIALPIIRMTKGAWWHAGLAVGLGFGVLASSQLLFPNSFMPEPVRMAHFVEILTSNFVFGWILAFLLTRTKHAAQLRVAAA